MRCRKMTGFVPLSASVSSTILLFTVLALRGCYDRGKEGDLSAEERWTLQL